MSAPYKSSGKIVHRAWFSPEEYKTLYEGTRERILEIEVRGKRGVGYCKSMPGAVTPFERLKERNKPPTPDTLIFGKIQRELFNTLLDELGLKIDRDGQRRSAYSLRHT
jgi:hypothetical protein